MSRSASASPAPRVFVAHPLCPPNLRAIVEDAVEAFDSDLTAKWAKPRKPHGKASGRSFTGAEAAEMAADKAEKSSKMPDRRPTREDSPESCDGEVIVPATPLRPAQLAGESQGGNTITLALRTPEQLRLGPDLAPKVTPPRETELHGNCRPRQPPPALVRPRQG